MTRRAFFGRIVAACVVGRASVQRWVGVDFATGPDRTGYTVLIDEFHCQRAGVFFLGRFQ